MKTMLSAIFTLVAAAGAVAQITPLPSPQLASVPTRIMADSLDTDLVKRTAVFRGGVTIADAAFNMRAEEMTVSFNTEANGVDKIHARGRVRVEQLDKSASAEEAIYFVSEKKIVMNGSPRVMQGKNVLTGQSITFFRDTNRIKVDGRTVLVIDNPDALGSFAPKPQAGELPKTETIPPTGTGKK